jgi:hypothetical protein
MDGLVAKLGNPMGRYIVRFRAGLTCQPEDGRKFFVDIVRADTFNLGGPGNYRESLGTYEITGTVEAPQVFEFHFENKGEFDDRIGVISYRMPTNSLFAEFEKETGLDRVGTHQMTHYQQLTWRAEKLCSHFATLLRKMKAIQEADGSTLFDNMLVVMGSGLRTGHERRNVPILIGGGSGVRHGSNYVYKENEGKLGNLWLSMLKYAGCPVDSFADSDGPLTEIFDEERSVTC